MENGSSKINPEECGLSEKVQVRKSAKDMGPGEIAEMVFEMVINHRIMESRLEKLENRVNILTSLMSQKGINVPS